VFVEFLENIGVEEHFSGARWVAWVQQTFVTVGWFRRKLLAKVVVLLIGFEIGIPASALGRELVVGPWPSFEDVLLGEIHR